MPKWAASPQLLSQQRAMKAIIVALILSLVGAECALAADLPAPGPAPIPPNSYYPVSPPLNWAASISASTAATASDAATGPMLWGRPALSQSTEALPAARSASIMPASATGCCWVRRRLRLVRRDRQCRMHGPRGGDSNCQTKIDWLSTFRLRAGYTWSHFLFYY